MSTSDAPPPSDLRHAVVLPPPPDTIPESDRKTLHPGEPDCGDHDFWAEEIEPFDWNVDSLRRGGAA